MRIIFLLSNLFTFLFSFPSLYKLDKDFEIKTTKTTYKLILKDQKYLNYQKIRGFKFFIPKYTKEFNLKIIRYNSIGYINGILFMKNKGKLISSKDLKYYFTDFKTGFQLHYLLNGYTIPYEKATSLTIEMYNIPIEVSSRLNKFIYFKRIPIPHNKLKYILYSCYIILDKKMVDKTIKKLYPKSKNYILTFLKKIHNLNIKNKRVVSKRNIVSKKVLRKHSYHLNTKMLLFMKNYFIANKFDTKELYSKILDLKFNISDKIRSIKILKELENIISDNECIFNPKHIQKRCFKNLNYFNTYINYLISKDKMLDDETILAYGDYKTFNNVGKYYYNFKNPKKAEIYFQKAYILASNKSIPAHNLAVLYLTKPLFNEKKALRYLKESNLSIDYYNLGIMYYIGLGVKESDKKAREYFKKAISLPMSRKNYEIMVKYNIGK